MRFLHKPKAYIETKGGIQESRTACREGSMEGEFLPVCREDMEQRGIARFDFVYIIGDAYVDHPSFGHGSGAGESGTGMD